MIAASRSRLHTNGRRGKSSKTSLRLAFSQRHGMLDGTMNDSLERWLAGERVRRSSCYDEAGFEEQLGRRQRKGALGVTSVELRRDMTRRVRRLRRAL